MSQTLIQESFRLERAVVFILLAFGLAGGLRLSQQPDTKRMEDRGLTR
jgi:hypothetical protein